MQHTSIHRVLLLLLCCIAIRVGAQTKMVVYTPIPMRSTSILLSQENKTDSWVKPGTWNEPYPDDDDSGGGGSDIPKPGTWDDPYWHEEEQEEVPIGSMVVLFGMAGVYAVWRLRKLRCKHALKQNLKI